MRLLLALSLIVANLGISACAPLTTPIVVEAASIEPAPRTAQPVAELPITQREGPATVLPTAPAAASASKPRPATKAAGDYSWTGTKWRTRDGRWEAAPGSRKWTSTYPANSSGPRWHQGGHAPTAQHLASEHGFDLAWAKSLTEAQRWAVHSDAHNQCVRESLVVRTKSSGHWATVRRCNGRTCVTERVWVSN